MLSKQRQKFYKQELPKLKKEKRELEQKIRCTKYKLNKEQVELKVINKKIKTRIKYSN